MALIELVADVWAGIVGVVEHAVRINRGSSAGSIGFCNVMEFSNSGVPLGLSLSLGDPLVMGNIALVFRANPEPAQDDRQ